MFCIFMHFVISNFSLCFHKSTILPHFTPHKKEELSTRNVNWKSLIFSGENGAKYRLSTFPHDPTNTTTI